MSRPSRSFLVLVSILSCLTLAAAGLYLTPEVRASLFGEPVATSKQATKGGTSQSEGRRTTTETIEVTDYSPPADPDTLLVDDRLEDKKTTFDASLVDRRPLQGWSLNASDAVIRLDVPIIKPDQDPELLTLYPSYSAACAKAKYTVLPSVNLIDGKAKQFDDGLYAAIDQAYFAGHGEAMRGHLKMVRAIYDKVVKGSPASDYLAAGLLLAKQPIEASANARSQADSFLSVEVFSKPIGVYTWTPALSDCFRVLRFYSQPIDDRKVTAEIARVLKEDKDLRAEYEKAVLFYGKLTNPLIGATPATLIDRPDLPEGTRISLFPPSSSREGDLFKKLFPIGLPPNVDLMRELITSIRSGKVDLTPRKDGGWYDYQVYALETLLLPEKGVESNKLLLTKLYKKRMLEAFKALITKRRETHVRQLEFPAPMSAAPRPKELDNVQPRLRVEPNPTYFLRTARSYAFLANFLGASLGETTMKSLHGLRENGPREMDLHAELHMMRDLFYGLHLLSAEDIGMKPSLLDGEAVDREACEKVATEWLKGYGNDADLAIDTRVSVPIFYDRPRNTTRLWMTIGVRLAKLDAAYAKAPSVRPENGNEEWKPLAPHQLAGSYYMIAVDEFAEVELKGGKVLTRAELRDLCDREKTKEKIVQAFKK